MNEQFVDSCAKVVALSIEVDRLNKIVIESDE